MADQSAAQNAKQPGKETHEENTSHEILTIESFPNEIISSIALTLSVDIHAPYMPSEYCQRTSADREKEDMNARRHLTSLCMVSKRISSNAQIALYRNILITEADTLVFLYRTLLENPKLGTYVKRISLNITTNEFGSVNGRYAFQRSSNDLGPLFSCAQHGLGEPRQLTVAVPGSRIASDKSIEEMIHILQFRVLGCTENLESLDLNVQPLEYLSVYGGDVHRNGVTKALHSLWEETSLCLSRLKGLQLIGKEWRDFGSRSDFVVLMGRYFLALPKLEQLIWYNHTDGWFDLLPNRMASGYYDDSGSATEAQYESIRTLKLQESSCFPRDLAALCSAFPHLESLSVDTDSRQCRLKMEVASRPPQLHDEHDPNSGMGAKCLTDSLASLANLTTLNLDLHWACNVSRTLGPSGILNLVDLPNLQALALPFQFFLKKEPEGHHKVVSPASVLPRALKILRIVACFDCLEFWISEQLPKALAIYQHQAAVLEFLDRLTNLQAASFPSLSKICYHESATWDACCWHNGIESAAHYNNTSPLCPYNYAGPLCPFHFVAESDISRLMDLSLKLLQGGVVFERNDGSFSCLRY